MNQARMWIVIGLSGLFLTAGSSRPEFLFRIHLEASKAENPDQVVTLNMGGSLGITRVREFAEMSENDIQSMILRPGGGALIQFNPGGRIRLEALTANNQGRLMCVFLNGRYLYAAEIDMVMDSGRLFLPKGVTPEDVDLFEKYLAYRKRG